MTKRPTNKDFFDQAKGFIASFNQVLEDGFFESLKVDLIGLENLGTTNICIQAQGLLPNQRRDWAPGVKVFVDPAEVIDSVREQIATSKFTLENYKCEVKTEEWLKFGTRNGEETVVGRKGLRISFSFIAYLKPKFWK